MKVTIYGPVSGQRPLIRQGRPSKPNRCNKKRCPGPGGRSLEHPPGPAPRQDAAVASSLAESFDVMESLRGLAASWTGMVRVKTPAL